METLHLNALSEALEAIEHGELKRLIVLMPPRHGKSELISLRYPCWYLAKHPTDYIVQAGYAESIALTHSRQARDIFISPEMIRLFPDIRHRPERPGQETIIPERQAAHEWGTKQGGSYYAVGIGGGLTGRGFNIGIIDDPVKDEEEAASQTIRDKVWDWYQRVFRTRAEPDAAIIVVMCMTGDTPVLMSDGVERPLREIKVGDHVATYDNGRLRTSTVQNHKSNGLDYVFRIRTTCGRIVHANERHPFLVEENGLLKWVRLKNLTTAHKIVTLRDSGANGKARPVLSRVAKHSLLPNTSDFTTESIASIEPAGVEEVFDIEIERTENFIANGLVSHNTRWHQDDLVGRLLKQAKEDPTSDQWIVLHFPAIKDGKALWPERYPIKALEQIRSSIGSRAFESLYQGNPTIAEGQIIKREWWQYFNEPPQFIRTIHSWDTAFKDKTLNDYSVCTVWGEAQSGIYLLGVWRAKIEFPELKRVVMSLYDKDRPSAVLVEDKASGQSLIQELQRETKIPVFPVKVDNNKVARANAVTPMIEAGKVFLPRSAPWLFDYIEELSAFPNAEYDDQVDSTTQALSFLLLRSEWRRL